MFYPREIVAAAFAHCFHPARKQPVSFFSFPFFFLFYLTGQRAADDTGNSVVLSNEIRRGHLSK